MYNEEGLQAGEKPTFCIQPKLFVTGELSDLSLIVEPKLKIVLTTRD